MHISPGAHTIGRATCGVIQQRLYPSPDNDISPCFLASLEAACPNGTGLACLNNLDLTTPDKFDNQYYRNLRRGKGFLRTDEVLYSTPGSNADLVKKYSVNHNAFFTQFGQSMIKMGNMPATRPESEIRLNCRFPNSALDSPVLHADQ